MVYNGEGQAAARLQSSHKTTLTEFFAYNAAAAAVDDTDGVADVALRLAYQDFLTHFTWDKAAKKWESRQRRAAQPQVGHIYSAHPGHGKRFFVRLLLCHVLGPVFFKVLCTLPDGAVADKFEEACRSRGLLADDLEWNRCLTEAASHQTCTASLRELFVSILRHCDVGDPLSLWRGHRDSLAEDFLHQAHATDPSRDMCDELHNLALLHIDRCLRSAGSTFRRLSTLPHATCRTRSSRSWPSTTTTSCGDCRTTVLTSSILSNALPSTASWLPAPPSSTKKADDGAFRRRITWDGVTAPSLPPFVPGGESASGAASTLLPHARTAHSLFIISSTSGPTLAVSWRSRAPGPSCCAWPMPYFRTRRSWPTGAVIKPSGDASGISWATTSRGVGKSSSWGATSGGSFRLFGKAHGLRSLAPA